MQLTEKQAEAIQNKAKYKVLNFGRRCFAPKTRVLTTTGYKEIKDITVNDIVVSFNLSEDRIEYKKVSANYMFGASFDPKPMLVLKIQGKEITTTYDHEFYHNKQWIPLFHCMQYVLFVSYPL